MGWGGVEMVHDDSDDEGKICIDEKGSGIDGRRRVEIVVAKELDATLVQKLPVGSQY